MSLHALVGRSRRTVRSSLLLGLGATLLSGAVCYAAYIVFFPDSVHTALDVRVPLLVPAMLAPVIAVLVYHFSSRLATERIKLDAARKLLRQEAEQRRRAEAKVGQLIQSDQVTGLPNERCFQDRVAQAIARSRRNGAPLALMKIGIDRFDSIAQQFGREIIDEMMRQVARAVETSLREVDTPGRVADNVVAVLLENTGLIQARTVAERLKTQIEATAIPTPVGSIAVTCSLGIAQIDARHEDAADLFARSSEALRQARETGGGAVYLNRDDQMVAA